MRPACHSRRSVAWRGLAAGFEHGGVVVAAAVPPEQLTLIESGDLELLLRTDKPRAAGVRRWTS